MLLMVLRTVEDEKRDGEGLREIDRGKQDLSLLFVLHHSSLISTFDYTL